MLKIQNRKRRVIIVKLLETVKVVITIVSLVILINNNCGAEFKFVAMADSRGSDNGVNTAVLEQIVQQVIKEAPKLIIFPGDLINGSTDQTIVQQQYEQWKTTMKPIYDAKIPVYPIPGNHEVANRSYNEEVFREVFVLPVNGPENNQETTYSFDYQNVHFVGVNTNKFDGPHKIDYNWLKTDLEATKKDLIFIFGHEPAYPVGPHLKKSMDAATKERNMFWKLLSKHKVVAYICGHEHFYDRMTINNVLQIIVGTCGAPIYTNFDCGEFYHYMTVDVGDKKVSFVVKDDKGEIRDQFEFQITK